MRRVKGRGRLASWRAAFTITTLAAGLAASAASAPEESVASGLRHDVVFTAYTPLSSNGEIARRTLTPLTNMQIERSPDGANLRSQAIDLTAEKFIVRVPRNCPAAGYGVFVFVPPWQDARLPAGWGPVLDDAGVIFVAAAKSGNDENIFGRRIPLALLGAHNVIQRYSVDADRVYVGGFSGGARVAMRVALGYPDLFRGAVLNAGSDPVGTSQAGLPPDDLFARFQASSHIVYVTGMDDATNVTRDMGSRGSMNARIAGDMRKDFEAIGHAAERGDPHAAWKLLVMADARYGGLARPQIVELAQRIGGPH